MQWWTGSGLCGLSRPNCELLSYLYLFSDVGSLKLAMVGSAYTMELSKCYK